MFMVAQFVSFLIKKIRRFENENIFLSTVDIMKCHEHFSGFILTNKKLR